jgi:opacity protein-like surface antigen
MRKLLVLSSSMIMMLGFMISARAQSSDQPKNEIEVRGTYSIPSGEANFSGTTASGSTIDFGRDFDFHNEFGFGVRYTYRSSNGKHKLGADYDSTNWERSTTLSRTIVFGGVTYNANLNLDGNLKLQVFRAMYSYRWGNDKVRIGPMVDMGVVKTSLNLTGTTNSGTRSAEGSVSKFAATIGYDLDYTPSSTFSLFHNLGAIVYSGDHLFHTEGGVKVFVAKNLGVVGGYKAQRYKFEENEPNFLTVRQHGPFFGGVFRF